MQHTLLIVIIMIVNRNVLLIYFDINQSKKVIEAEISIFKRVNVIFDLRNLEENLEVVKYKNSMMCN